MPAHATKRNAKGAFGLASRGGLRYNHRYMTTVGKNSLVQFASVADFLTALVFAYYSPQLTNLIAPLMDWEVEEEINFLLRSPFLSGMAITFVPIVLYVVGFYHRGNVQRVSTALRQLLLFTVYYLSAIAFYQTLRVHDAYVSHILLVNMVGIPVCLFLRFLLVRMWKLRIHRNPDDLRQVILAGASEEAINEAWNKLPGYWRAGMHVVGHSIAGKTEPAEIQKLIAAKAVSHLIVFGGISAYHDNEPTIHLCELQGIDIYICRNEHRSVELKTDVNDVEGVYMLILTSTPPYSWERLAKGVFDRLMALAMLIGSSPLWLITAIGIKLSDPTGPVFYRQKRSGLYGKPFGMWKFRSMYTDAEERLEEIKKQMGNEMDGPLFKLHNDPRIFPFGRFIRKMSIDELPQVLNILVGDMSIVGPRPLAVYETEEMPDLAHRRRMSVKPGLTCYWQIEDRSDAENSYQKMIEKDLKYIDNWSFWLDIVLFLRTIPAVLFGKGAV